MLPLHAAAREKDDVATTRVLAVRMAVDLEHEVAVFDEVHGADVGEADRDGRQRGVRNNPLAIGRTLRSSSDSKSYGWPCVASSFSKPSSAGRSARFSGGAVIVATHSSEIWSAATVSQRTEMTPPRRKQNP